MTELGWGLVGTEDSRYKPDRLHKTTDVELKTYFPSLWGKFSDCGEAEVLNPTTANIRSVSLPPVELVRRDDTVRKII